MQSSPPVPGIQPLRETYEASVLFQTFFQGDVVFAVSPRIASAAVDAGNTPTTVLRQGLVMAKVASTGQWSPYDADATNGTQYAKGVLVQEFDMLNYATAAAEMKFSSGIVIGGKAIANRLINLDQQARSQLRACGFRFDDEDVGPGYAPGAVNIVPKAADYTVLATDHGTLFTTDGASGAVNFTLPTLAAGLRFEFLNTVNQNMTVTSGDADKMLVDGDAGADSVAFSTSSHKIGGWVEVTAMYFAGTLLWAVHVKSGPGNTVTVAT